MSSHKGTLSPEEGARSALFAALLPPGTDINGKVTRFFFKDPKEGYPTHITNSFCVETYWIIDFILVYLARLLRCGLGEWHTTNSLLNRQS